MLKVVPSKPDSRKDFELSLDEIAREGARRLLVQALDLEVEEYIQQHIAEVDEAGRRLVVRNGYGKSRTVTMGGGGVDVEVPRIKDRREGKRYLSTILPPYLRKSPKIESLLPVLYLKGLSTMDFKSALGEFLGQGTQGLSPASIVKLKRSWEVDFDRWSKRPIEKQYVYIWADGVNVQVRLGEDKKICLLVVIGATETGEKELLAVHPGYRESKDSWLTALRSLIDRGMSAPKLAIGDGALGFWAAIRTCEGFEKTEEQRCWVHKIANVLDKLPKRLQSDAKGLLHDMMKAEKEEDACKVKNSFEKLYLEKYPKAVECLTKSWSELTTFFHYPALHWQHIRTTNPIESSFATVKLRTKATKGAGSKEAATVMAFKLLCECERRWRKLKGYQDFTNLLKGLEYKDGVVIPRAEHHEAAAS
jgi:transposase-like protein